MGNGKYDLRLVAKPASEEGMSIREAQEEAAAIRREKGFSSDVPYNFMLMTEEVGEASNAWRMNKPDRGEELADVFIYTARIAELTGVDLEAEVKAKFQKVRQRTYERMPNGTLRKTEREAT